MSHLVKGGLEVKGCYFQFCTCVWGLDQRSDQTWDPMVLAKPKLGMGEQVISGYVPLDTFHHLAVRTIAGIYQIMMAM